MKRLLILLLFTASLQAQAPPSFREGFLAFEQGDFATAEKKMREAIAGNPNETEGTVRISGEWFESYVPHYFLARALAKQGKCAEAIREFEESERQGVTPQISDFARHLKTRGGCKPQAKSPEPKKVVGEVTVPFGGGGEVVAPPKEKVPVLPKVAPKEKTERESHPSLQQAVEAYLRGNYQETVRLLANMSYSDPAARAETALFRAAAHDALDRINGTDVHRKQVDADLRIYRSLRPNGSPDPRVFPPRFIAMVRTGSPNNPIRSR